MNTRRENILVAGTAAPFSSSARRVDAPLPHAFLAAAYSRLAQASEAQAALARYRALSPQTLDAFAAIQLRDPAQRKLFLDGIALAEGKMPPDAATDG